MTKKLKLGDIINFSVQVFDPKTRNLIHIDKQGEITNAILEVLVLNTSDWNSMLDYIDLYTMSTWTWSSFYNTSDQSKYGYLGGYNFHGGETEYDVLTFQLFESNLQGKSEMGFSFRAYPEIPSGSVGDQTHRIILYYPLLTITYIP